MLTYWFNMPIAVSILFIYSADHTFEYRENTQKGFLGYRENQISNRTEVYSKKTSIIWVSYMRTYNNKIKILMSLCTGELICVNLLSDFADNIHLKENISILE